jgi:hypothetical protein
MLMINTLKKTDKPSFPTICPLLAPQKVEFKNLWWDFRKVVDYIQQNEKWLLPA